MALAVRSNSSTLPEKLPADSLLRLYDPSTEGNSFSLDGFPALKEGKSWQARLTGYIQGSGVLGMTTNQTLFRSLMDAGVLDGRLQEFKSQGRLPREAYQVLYNEATTEAARLFSPVHNRWPWEGRVSQEASALLTELDPLVKEVRRISGAMTGVGAFTKIPNLPIGAQAVHRAVSAGRVHPNITLVFSDLHYVDTVEGYLWGIRDLAANLRAQGQDEGGVRRELSRIHSVNSLFVSRVDRVADPMIEERLKKAAASGERERLQMLKGKTAVAQAKWVYRIFEAVFLGRPLADPQGLCRDDQGRQMLLRIEALGELFGELKEMGANPQRLLIASSGVKSDQPFSPLLYVLPFLGPWSANTLPEGTLDQLIRFISELKEEQANSLRERRLISEPLPALPTDVKPTEQWDRALLMTSQERAKEGIREISPDEVLRDVQALVLGPAGTTLRKICDTLRDKGAAGFTADEQATLDALEKKLQRL